MPMPSFDDVYNDTPAFAAFDASKALAAGLRYRSVEESLRANREWFRNNYPPDFDFAAAGYGLSPAEEAEGLERARREGLWFAGHGPVRFRA